MKKCVFLIVLVTLVLINLGNDTPKPIKDAPIIDFHSIRDLNFIKLQAKIKIIEIGTQDESLKKKLNQIIEDLDKVIKARTIDDLKKIQIKPHFE